MREFDPTNTSMRGSLNFQELHQGHWGVIRLLGVFDDFKLKWGMMGVHHLMKGCFCFEI
jgi:hypothetical protein